MDVQFVETIEEKKEALLEQVMYLQGPGLYIAQVERGQKG